MLIKRIGIITNVQRYEISNFSNIVLLTIVSCGEKQKAMNATIIQSAEEGLAYLETDQPTGEFFQLAISDSFTFVGQPDTMGVGMAVLLDKILGLGFEPDGFDQKDGYKLYKYKEME